MSQDPPITVARRQVVIENALGLHMRPASKFTQMARQYQSEIRVYCNGQEINGKSMLDMTTLAAELGTQLDLEARGVDAEAALEALVELVRAKFHDHESEEGLDEGFAP